MTTTFNFTPRVTDSLGRQAVSGQKIQFWPTLVAEMLFNGADGSTVMTETTGRVVTRFGNTMLKTDAPFAGTASCRFDGAGDYLELPHDTQFDASGDFRCEMAIRPATITKLMCLVQKRPAGGSSSWSFVLNPDGQLQLLVWSASGAVVVNIIGAGVLSQDVWCPVAVEKIGANWRIENSTVTDAYGTQTGTPGTNTSPLRIGRDSSFTTRDFWGNIDQFRFLRP